MTMTESIQTMARRLRKAIDQDGDAGAFAVMAEIVRVHGRDVGRAVFEAAQGRAEAEWAEAKGRHEAEARRIDEIKRLFKACPEAKTVYQACKIMADRGDAFAQSMLALLDSRDYRLEVALADAAADLHPSFRRDDDGTIVRLDDSAPQPRALVEWLYKTHPARVRAIETAIRREARYG